MSADARPYLPWPPPGLETVHARLWPVVLVLAVGDVVLIGPLMWALIGDWSFWSLGPFGSSWWVLIVMSLAGVVILLAGFERLARLLWMAYRASQRGHRWLTVLQVAADTPRDTGFVLLGARQYASLAPPQRSTILATRLVSTIALFGAACWVPIGFVLSVMLAGRGLIGPGLMGFATIGPTAALIAIALPGRFMEARLRRAARKDPAARAADDQALSAKVADWNQGIDAATAGVQIATRSSETPRGFQWAAVVVAIGAIVLVIPAATVGFTSGLAPMTAAIAIPKFSSIQARVGTANALRGYRIAPDSTSPREAGEALHALFRVGDAQRREHMQQPVRRYEQPWFPEDPDSAITTQVDDEWIMALFARTRSFSTAERSFLQAVATHPAQREWSTVARAPAIDLIGTRFVTPFDSITAWTLPLPRFSVIRDGIRAHIAMAAWELSRGRAAEAERTIKEVISTGFGMIDDGPTLIDNLIGLVAVRDGGRALEQLYRATGRATEADGLELVRTVAQEVRQSASTSIGFNLQEAMRHIPTIVPDTNYVLGLRWEFFLTTSTFAPCLNLKNLMFGPDDSYASWKARARESLVRRSSDEPYFELLSRGPGSLAGSDMPFPLRAVLRFTFGRGRVTETCGGFVQVL
ncbi:MAG TPA: hypothetical protein VGA37_12280 [Gemmatimonadales bacterium]